ncbi:MAG TPA: TonB family protein, partial [Pyrinomonadaceae bacterium]
VKKTEAACPPAARAVRACDNKVEVYVIIDRKGAVIFARAVSGHPLLQQAGASAVKNWKFKPAKKEDKTYNATGYITVEFQQSDETLN